MKKRIISLLLAVLVIFSLCSCTFGGGGYEFESASVTSLLSSEYPGMVDTFEFVYEDTKLKISDDGTWVIDYNIFLFINSPIDEGTYEMDGDTYVFDGFEYGMDTYGNETEDGFEIYFYIPTPEGERLAATLYFEK